MLARGPFQDGLLKDFHDAPPVDPFPSPDALRPPAAAVAWPKPLQQPPPDFQQKSLAASAYLFELAGKPFIRNINAHKVSFIVAAARHFGPPVIGRASTYEGSQIIVFRDAVPDVAVQGTAQERLSLVKIDHHGVVRLDTEEKWGEKDERITVYYAKPKPSVLVAATDIGFLVTMLQRIARPLASRTQLLDFPEWKYVDVQSPVWGVRHRRTTTPIYVLARTEKSGLPFSELSGTSFTYQPKPAKCVAYRFHFPDKSHDTVRQAVIGDSALRLMAPSVVENKMLISPQETASELGAGTAESAAFMIQHLMGYVVCP